MQFSERALYVHNLNENHVFYFYQFIFPYIFWACSYVFLLILLTYYLPGGFGQVTVEETSGLPLLSDIRDILT